MSACDPARVRRLVPVPGERNQGPAAPARALGTVTLCRLSQATGELASVGVAAMAERLPWFSRLTAEQRAAVLLVTQVGAANFVEWLREPEQIPRLTAEAFRTAPRDLARRVSLRQTVELVRVATDVFEQRVPLLAADEVERAALVAAVLRFGREVAFAAATVYAGAAESRGAWDARLEALVVDGVVRGDDEESLLSRAAALGWDPGGTATILVGGAPPEDFPQLLSQVRRAGARAGRPVLVGVQGARLVMIVGGGHRPTAGPDHQAFAGLAEAFADGPVVVGHTVAGLASAHHSARAALSGLRAVVAWPTAPRPVAADDLLPERTLAGDADAARQLVEDVAVPLMAAEGGLVETVETYLDSGGVLEACARALFVHPNTVRYRLRKVTDITGQRVADPRGALVLRMALAAARLRRPQRDADLS